MCSWHALGALGSFGAALLEPYSDRPDYSGILRTSPESLEKLVQQFWKDDFQVVRPSLPHIHNC
jgi:predicted amidohydrolase YtcJ